MDAGTSKLAALRRSPGDHCQAPRPLANRHPLPLGSCSSTYTVMKFDMKSVGRRLQPRILALRRSSHEHRHPKLRRLLRGIRSSAPVQSQVAQARADSISAQASYSATAFRTEIAGERLAPHGIKGLLDLLAYVDRRKTSAGAAPIVARPVPSPSNGR